MDFFEHQEQARRQTKFLVVMFLLAVIGIVISVVLVVSTVTVNVSNHSGQLMVPNLAWAGEHAGLLGLISLGSAGFIGLASLYRVASLSSGGGTVARKLGGTLITPDTQDPLRRRLHNVVEEMAIASGVPVPEVYVLEQEPGLNAFAAGFSSGDAAVTVTRGSLESLSRNELQGIIAHEFSHILNGDMRLNMRLIGILFGILAVSLVGRTILRGARHTGIRSRRSGKGGGMAVAMLLGLSLTLIGFIGLFFGRLIKAAVSRQREYLADASAVQFTRQTEGIAGALKKIGYGADSIIEDSDGEEVSHMLFANGVRYFSSLYATHPPIEKRIKALDPYFDPEQYLETTAQKQLAEEAKAGGATNAGNARGRLDGLMHALFVLTPETVGNAVGNPTGAQLQQASELRSLIPAHVYEAAHSSVGAMFLTLALLLDHDDTIRDQQLKRLAKLFKPEYIQVMTGLHTGVMELGPPFRLPLLEITFPALKCRPQKQISMLLNLVNELIEYDGRVDTFEYLLSRVLLSHLTDAERPQRANMKRKVRLGNSLDELQILFSVVAHIGHKDDAAQTRTAYQLGMRSLLTTSMDWPNYAQPARWTTAMDTALAKLDRLPTMIKRELIKAVVTTISHDEKVTVDEAELLRAICAILHCPLPLFLINS